MKGRSISEMPVSASSLSRPLVLAVRDDIGVSEALGVALERVGGEPVRIKQHSDARMVVQGAPALAVMLSSARCHAGPAAAEPAGRAQAGAGPDRTLLHA